MYRGSAADFLALQGFCANREFHRKCHRKVTTHIQSTFFGLVACRDCSLRRVLQEGLGGLLSKTAVSKAISGSRAVHT